MSHTKIHIFASLEKLRLLSNTILISLGQQSNEIDDSLDGVRTLLIYYNPHLAHLIYITCLAPAKPPEFEIVALHLYSPSRTYSHSPRTYTPGRVSLLAPNPSPSWWVTLMFTPTTHPKSLLISCPWFAAPL